MSHIDDLIAEHCPNGVEFAQIGTLVEPSRKIQWDNHQEEIDYIDLSSVDRDTHRITTTTVIDRDSAPSRAQQLVRAGDVLFGTTRPMLRRYCLVPEVLDGQVASTGFCVLRPTRLISSEWLYHLLGTPAFYDHVNAEQRGASYPAISDARVKRFRIPVPPPAVQREIASILDKMERLQAELEAELEAELHLRSRQYAYYRDSLLTFDERERVRWAKLGDVGSLYGGLTGKSKVDFQGGNARFVTYVNVFNNLRTDTRPDTFVRVDAGERQNGVRRGDVLFTASSESSDEVGMASAVTVEPDEPLYLNSFCFGFRPDVTSDLNPEFAKHLFRSAAVRQQITKTANGVTRINISKDRFRKVKIPLPSPAEQSRIARILDKFDALVNDLSVGLPAEIAARRKQYEYYHDRLLTFKEAA